MASHRKYLFAILGVATLSVATSSFALNLGRAKGTVFLGQTLQLVVPVQMEAGEGASALCVEADVFYGDTRQDASRVAVASEWHSQSQSANLTVSSRSTVDEPVVTVYLRAGCESKTTRRYVLLSELAPTVVPSATTVNPPSVSLLRRSAPAASAPTSEKKADPQQRAAKQAKTGPIAKGSGVAQMKQLAPTPPKATGRRAHLKLAPLDLTQEYEPALKLTNELVAVESEDLQKRARAVALWRALNATPQEILSTDSRRQAYGIDIKNLQGITVKNRVLLEDMTRRLDQAETGRYSNPLVYGLFAAIAAVCLAIALSWRRARQGGLASEPWWRNDGVSDKSDAVDVGNGVGGKVSSVEQRVGQSLKVSQSVPHEDARSQPLSNAAPIDIDLQLDDPVDAGRSIPQYSSVRRDPVQAKPNKQPPRSAGHQDFGHSMSATLLRSVNSKEMLDVRQQAEFFMTLGQQEAAIALLTDNVEDGPEANPLVYLELLKVLHTLGRKGEYDHYRQGFNAIFNGHVPVYADFNQVGSGLEAYTPVCQQIVALWPSEAAVAYIESCLSRRHMESGGQDFDLEAFRDLLMLHGVASRIASVSFDSGFIAFSAAKTAPVPMSPVPDVAADFDAAEPLDGNLIDFDTSGWSPSTPGGSKRKAS